MNKKNKKNIYMFILLVLVICLTFLSIFNLKKDLLLGEVKKQEKIEVECKKYQLNSSNNIEIEAHPGISNLSDLDSFEAIGKKALSFLVNIIFVIIRGLIYIIIAAIANAFGLFLSLIGGEAHYITVENVLFNKFPLLNLQLFSSNGANVETVVKAFGGTFVIVLSLSLLLQLVVLVYLVVKGIVRTSILQTYVSKETKRKDIVNIILEWSYGVAQMVLLIVYVFVLISVNNIIVKAISASYNFGGEVKLTEHVRNGIFSISIMEGTSCLILYTTLRIYGFSLFFTYLKRMIKVGFLICISPLVATKYAIEKIDSGSSQAVEGWKKIVAQTIFSQSIQAIIFITTVGIVIPTAGTNLSLGGIVLIILGFNFIFTGEKIIYEMFNMKPETGIGKSVSQSLAMVTGGKAILEKAKVFEKVAKRKPGKFKNKLKEKTGENKFVQRFEEYKIERKEKQVIKRKKFPKISGFFKDPSLKLKRFSVKMKTAAYEKFGLKAPKKRYAEELKRAEKNLKLKKLYKKQLKRSKKKGSGRFKRFLVGSTLAAYKLAEKISTSEIGGITDIAEPIVVGGAESKVIAKAFRDRKSYLDEVKESDSKANNNVKETFSHKNETALRENEGINSARYRELEENFAKEMKITLENKNVTSGINFDLTTREGKENYSKYSSTFDILSEEETAGILEETRIEIERKISDYLTKKEKKSMQDVDKVLSEIKSIIVNGGKIKGNDDTEFNSLKLEYADILIDEKVFVMKNEYNYLTEKINADFSNVENALKNIDRYDTIRGNRLADEINEETIEIDIEEI